MNCRCNFFCLGNEKSEIREIYNSRLESGVFLSCDIKIFMLFALNKTGALVNEK